MTTVRAYRARYCSKRDTRTREVMRLPLRYPLILHNAELPCVNILCLRGCSRRDTRYRTDTLIGATILRSSVAVDISWIAVQIGHVPWLHVTRDIAARCALALAHYRAQCGRGTIRTCMIED